MSASLAPLLIGALVLIALVVVAVVTTVMIMTRTRNGQHTLDLDLRARVVALEQRVERLEARRF